VSALLRADSVGKRLGGRDVLHSAYFEAEAGSITALVGRNGAGKSTLLRIAAGWLQPDQGWIEFAGTRRIPAVASALAEAGLFLLPVDRSILSGAFTLQQHVEAFQWRFGCQDIADLDQFEVTHLVGAPVGTLSGGERRRAELALAFMRRASCLMIDEPFLGIDPRHAEGTRDALLAARNRGAAVVISGHEQAWVLDLADRVVWVRQGSTEAIGNPRDARDHWRFRRDYLGLTG